MKISMTCAQRLWRSNKNGTEAMNTSKNNIFIGLWPECCYLVGEINLWWWQRIKIWWWSWGSQLGKLFPVGEWANVWLVVGLPQQGNPLDCCATSQLVLATLKNLFLILTWRLVNKATTQTKKPSKWVAENPTEYIFFIKIVWFKIPNAFCQLTRTILLWPFVSHPTRCKWLWLKIE